MKEGEFIILGDFAENYSFVVQDKVQGYHWNQQSCSLHPVVVYYLKDGKIAEQSLCIISDDLNHDTSFVYEVISMTISHIKENLNPAMKKAHYFSDGCAGQYKNCKNFFNLCLHQADFGVNCIWSFFATSHGKSPCDGIGGTVKRLTARASLQRVSRNFILSAQEVHEFCKSNVPGIVSLFVNQEKLNDVRTSLKDRFAQASTLPGTRSFHHFVPVTSSIIAAKRVSTDAEYSIQYDLVMGAKVDNVDVSEIKVSEFGMFQYDENLWLGVILLIDKDEQDFKVKFMHPAFPARTYVWPRNDDICFVPHIHMLCKVGAPITRSGRTYSLIQSDICMIENELKKQKL